MNTTQPGRDHYYRRYGLDGDPFPVDEPDRVLFLTPELERRLQKLRQWIKAGRQMLVVTAPHGAGKTRLSEQLDSVGDDDWLIVRVQAEADHDVDSLVDALLYQAFPEREEEADDARDRLLAGLQQAAAEGLSPVVVIDDAHCLPAATLAAVIDWTGLRHNDACFHFVLFAEERIQDRLQDLDPAALPEDGPVTLQLPALTETQAGEYIRHRILSYGHIRNDPFGEATLERIYQVSGGLPGGINHLAREAMQAPAGTNRGGRLLAAGGLLLLAAAAGWYFQGALPGTTPAERPVAAAQTAPPAPTAATAAAPPEVPADEGPAGEAPPAMTETVTLDPDEGADDGLSVATVRPAAAATDSAPAAEPEAEPKPAPARTPSAADETTAGTTAESDRPAAVAKGEEEDRPAAPAASPLTRAEQTSERPARVESGSETTRSITGAPAAPDQDNIFDLARVPDWAGGLRGEDWLRRQEPGALALQLISASRLQNVAKLVRAYPGPDYDFAGFTNYTPSGKPRYRLYYGLYPDRDSALAAVQSLPPALRRLQPWPRPLRAIHKELDDKQERFTKK